MSVAFSFSLLPCPLFELFFFFFHDTATTEIYTLSLHDALPISSPPGSPTRRTARPCSSLRDGRSTRARPARPRPRSGPGRTRSEELTSERQSRLHLVCRRLLEKKKKILNTDTSDSSHLLRQLQT